jgi:N-acetylglutamate synthase-like GNAT family acetyltransferase
MAHNLYFNCGLKIAQPLKIANFSSRRENFFQNQSMPQLHIRRATVDDLPALRSLWTAARFPADELENRLTEFQVVEAGGVFAGALGLQILRQHALLHSEDYADFAIADAARELFWERIQTLAAHHGVFRVWTQETSPFWTHWGFQPANAELLASLPDEWKNLAGRWLTLELKNAEVITAALENQFAGFMDAEKKQTAQVAAQARKFKLFITVAGFTIGGVCFALALWRMFHQGALPH